MSAVHQLTIALIVGALATTPVVAQDDSEDQAESKRTRIALGPQLVPSWPGSDGVVLRPFTDISSASGEQPFEFEAPDESIGFAIVRTAGFSFGPSIGFEGKRSADEVGGNLPDVDFSFEIGGFVNFDLSDNLRLRAEARQAVSGHEGFIARLGADYVVRDADDYLFSIGPRVAITDGRYQDAYYSVTPAESLASGLATFDASGGVHSIGVTAGYIQQLTERWGFYAYAKYDRLVGDPAESPIVAAFGSRDQFAGGIALTYTFDGGIF